MCQSRALSRNNRKQRVRVLDSTELELFLLIYGRVYPDTDGIAQGFSFGPGGPIRPNKITRQDRNAWEPHRFEARELVLAWSRASYSQGPRCRARRRCCELLGLPEIKRRGQGAPELALFSDPLAPIRKTSPPTSRAPRPCNRLHRRGFLLLYFFLIFFLFPSCIASPVYLANVTKRDDPRWIHVRNSTDEKRTSSTQGNKWCLRSIRLDEVCRVYERIGLDSFDRISSIIIKIVRIASVSTIISMECFNKILISYLLSA